MSSPTASVAVTYRDPRAAVDWLARAFGFELTMAIEGPDGDAAASHYEMSPGGGGRLIVGGEWTEWTRSPASVGGANTQSTHIQLPGELDRHCERAREAGAAIAAEPDDQFYGDRTYRAVDPEGHVWTFAMHLRDVSRAEAEQAIGARITSSSWA